MNDKVMTAEPSVTSYGVVNLYNKGLLGGSKQKRLKSGNPYARNKKKLYDVEVVKKKINLQVEKTRKMLKEKKKVSERSLSSEDNEDPNILMKFVTQLNFNELNVTPSLNKLNQDKVGKEDHTATDREVNLIVSKHCNSGNNIDERRSSLVMENKAPVDS